jgi:hypothetical protein
MVNRSVTWADWDEDLLSLELQELNAEDFDLSLTGFDPGEIDGLLAIPDEERANAAPPLPENPISRVGDLWICGKHRVPCGDALRREPVVRLLGGRKPVRGEFIKSRGDRRLVQPATVLLPAIRGKAYRRRSAARIWQLSF